MIVKLNHETGAEIETSIGPAGELTPADIARGVLSVLVGVTCVRVWEDGRSFLGPPSADVARGSEDGPKPVDEARREAREALAARVADSLGGGLEGFGPTLETSKWEHSYSGASQVMPAAQRSVSGNLLPPV